MRSIKISAPAKVNLFLKILNKRQDGYHNISTLFERIALCDGITISRIPEGIKVSSDVFITADPRENLVYKAAAEVLRYGKVKGGVKIRVEKRIPIAAGLGGGSSDAAAVLAGINKLFKLGLTRGELLRLGSGIGADVPFFLSNMPFALGTARGERLSRVNLKKRLWHLIVYPGFGLSTKDIYKAFDHNIMTGSKGLTKKPADVRIQPGIRTSMDLDELEEMLHNDLQDIAVAKKKILGRVIERLASSLDKRIIVSGSGPSVFCLCGTRKEASEARDKLLAYVPLPVRKKWQIFIAGTKI